jgi:hypothetical protein
MHSKLMVGLTALSLLALADVPSAQAQFEDPEGGVTQPSGQSGGTGTTGTTAGSRAGGGSSDSGIRLAFQGRLDVINLAVSNQFAPLFSPAPITTTGVRVLDGKLFAGLGVGFGSRNDGGASAFTMSPLVSFDVLSTDLAALYAVSWLNIGKVEGAGGGGLGGNDTPLVGLNLGAGIRGKINEAIAIGSEWGWGFVKFTDQPAQDFTNGFWGTIMFEASIGL